MLVLVLLLLRHVELTPLSNTQKPLQVLLGNMQATSPSNRKPQ